MMIVSAVHALSSSAQTVNGPLREVDLVHVLGHDLDALMQCPARGSAAISSGPAIFVGKARIVLDVVRDHELAAGDAAAREPLEHEGLEVGARGVDAGGQPCRAGADDDDLGAESLRSWPAGLRRKVASSTARDLAGPSRQFNRYATPTLMTLSSW